MSQYDDPPEFVGRDQTIMADPKSGKRTAPPPVVAAKLVVEPVVTDKAPNTHPKFAIERPRREFEAAQAETIAALEEKRAATVGLVDAERAETEALNEWLALQPRVDPDQLLRDYATSALTERARQVSLGNPPEGVRTPTHGNSVMDIAASQRPRQSPQSASTPLRSRTARRVV